MNMTSALLVESNCCMTPNKLQENVLWHVYVILGQSLIILKVDTIRTTRKCSNQTLKKDGRQIKKDSLNICISVDCNSFRPVYMLQLLIFINIIMYTIAICDPNKRF